MDSRSPLTPARLTSVEEPDSPEQQRTFFLEDTIQFGYHLTCSDHMRIAKDRRSAEKIDPVQCYAHGVTYGEKPLRGTVEFEVELSSYGTAWSGTLKLGVMRIREGHHFEEIPRYSPEGNDYCVWSSSKIHNRLSFNGKNISFERPYGGVNLDDLRAGDRVGLRLTSEGVLSFFVNGDYQGMAAEDVYRKGSWVFIVIDHYANCKATRITRAVMNYDFSLQQMCVSLIPTWLKSSKDIESLPLPQRLKQRLKEYMEEVVY